MSWINNLNGSFQQISSLTGQLGGQISNFTREVLAEQADTETESIDQNDGNVESLKQKLVQLQELAKQKDNEVAKQRKLNSELETKFKSAQHQTHAMLQEYQHKMLQQDQVINELKSRLSDNNEAAAAATTSVDDGGYHVIVGAADDVAANKDDVTSEMEKLREELEEWKRKYEESKDSTDWKAKYLDLEDKFEKEIENHDQNLLQMQDEQDKLVEEFEKQIEELKNKRVDNDEEVEELKKKIVSLQDEIDEINTKNLELQHRPSTKQGEQETKLILGLVGVLPQLSERQSDDVSIVDDIIDAVAALHQQCASKHDADNRSFSSVSYECVEFDEASQQSSSSDADKESGGSSSGGTRNKTKNKRLLTMHEPRYQSSPVVAVKPASKPSEIVDDSEKIEEEDGIFDEMYNATIMNNPLMGADNDEGFNKNEAKLQIMNLEKRKNELEEKVSELEVLIGEERERYENVEERLRERNQQNEDLLVEVEGLKDALTEKKAELMETNEALETLDVQHNEEMTQLLDMRKKQDVEVRLMRSNLKQLEDELGKLRREKDDVTTSVTSQDHEEERRQLEHELHKSRDLNDTLQRRLADEEEERSRDRDEAKREAAILRNDIESLINARGVLEARVAAAREEGLEVERGLSEDLRRANDVIRDVTEERKRLKSEAQMRGKEVEELRTKLAGSEARIDDISDELARLKREKSELNERHDEEVARIEQELEQNDSLKQAQLDKLDRAQRECEERADTICKLQNEIAELQQSLEEEKGKADGGLLEGCQTAQQLIDKLTTSQQDDVIVSKPQVGVLLQSIRERDAELERLSAEVKTHRVEVQQQQQTPSSNTQDADEALRKEFEGEKDQMMAIISDKTRENRQLKDEARKMMDNIAASNNQIAKLSTANASYREKYESEGYNYEMTKETVQRLSKMISEKDFEIESLQQKCSTLLDVLQQDGKENKTEEEGESKANYSSQQIDQLLKEREILTGQVRQLLAEREQLVNLVKSNHEKAQEILTYAQSVAEAVERDGAENSRLQISYTNLVFDYEQIELKLTAQQRQVDRADELCKSLKNLKPPAPQQQANEQQQLVTSSQGSDDVVDSDVVKGLRGVIEKKSESLLQKDLLVQDSIKRASDAENKLQEVMSDSQNKDSMISKLGDEIERVKSDIKKKVNENSILKKSVENLREQITEINDLRTRLEENEKLVTEKSQETEAFQETNAQLTMMLKKQEYDKENLKEQVTRLESVMRQHQQGKESETQRYLNEVDQYKNEVTNLKQERDQFMFSVKQKQSELQRYHHQLKQLQDKEVKLQQELERLRSHLVDVEESYTQEAVLSEARENELKAKLDDERKRSVNLMQVNEQTRYQADKLHSQVNELTKQRDQTVQQYQVAQEKVHQYAQALTQLKSAAERMQRDEAATYNQQVDRINSKLQEKEREVEVKTKQLQQVQAKLDEVNEALELASRLSEQLELKEEDLERARQIVAEKQSQVEELQKTLNSITARNESMVDRQLVKNLFIGYFSSPPSKKDDVIKLIASMIGFSKEESDKLTSSSARNKGWMGSLLSWGVDATSVSSSHQKHNNESFSQMFVKFLEEESQKKQPPLVARLPVRAMADEAQLRSSQRKLNSGIPTAVDKLHDRGEATQPSIAGRYNPPIVIPNPISIAGTAASPFAQPQSFTTSGGFAPLVASHSSSSGGNSEQNILHKILQPNN